MVAPVVSAADAALVARVPALMLALRRLDGSAEASTEPTLRELVEVFFDGSAANAPTHPAAVDALLSANLVSLLLARVVATLGNWPVAVLERATFISSVASDQVGPVGFGRLLGIPECDAVSDPSLLTTLQNVAAMPSVTKAIRAVAGMPMLGRLFMYCDRSPSTYAFTTLDKVLRNAPAAIAHAVSALGLVPFLEKHMQQYLCITPDPSVARPLLLIFRSCMGRQLHIDMAIRPLYRYVAIAVGCGSLCTDYALRSARSRQRCRVGGGKRPARGGRRWRGVTSIRQFESPYFISPPTTNYSHSQ